MNDFFIAANRSLNLEVDDVSLEVRQIQMSQFDLWVGAVDHIKKMLGNVSDLDCHHSPRQISSILFA